MAPSKTVTTRSETAVSPVNPDQTLKASKALLAHMKKASQEKSEKSDKKDLFENEDEPSQDKPVWLTLTTKRHITESRSLRPGKITLPHPLVDTETDLAVCLITADPQRAYKNLVASDDFPAEWRKRVTRVIDVTKLGKKYKQYEQQRQLFAEHDVFLGDTRIINRLPKFLGKTFYKSTAKRPIPVELQARRPNVDGKRAKKATFNKEAGEINACTPPQLAGEIARAVNSALVHLSPSTNTAVRIGFAGWEPAAIAANAEAVSSALVSRFVPGQWKNVRSIYLKGAETTALPLWQTDELWVDGQTDVVADDSEQGQALLAAAAAKADKEKPNVGRKRKSVGSGDGKGEGEEEGQQQQKEQDEEEEDKPATKKAKKGGDDDGKQQQQQKKKNKDKLLPVSNDNTLDKEIAARKATLKKQKRAAKAAVDV